MAAASRILCFGLITVAVLCFGAALPWVSVRLAVPGDCACCCTDEHDGASACCAGLPEPPRRADSGAGTGATGCDRGCTCSCCGGPGPQGDAPTWMILGGCAPVRIAPRSDVEAVLAPIPLLVSGGGVTPCAMPPLAVNARLVRLGVRTI